MPPTELPTLDVPVPESERAAVGARRFRVEGMDCGACARTKAVSALDGVEAARVSFGAGTLALDGAVPDDAVLTAVKRMGYRAHSERDQGPARSWVREPRSISTIASALLDLLCLDVEKAEDLRNRRLEPGQAEDVAAQVKAFSDPTRLMLASALLDGGELCVCDLAWVSERAENLVSHHLRLLRTAGLASSRRDGKTVFYSLTARGEELLSVAFAKATSS